jgi:hypothetical protein
MTVEEFNAAIAENNRKRVAIDAEIDLKRSQLNALNRENEALERGLHEATRPASQSAGVAGEAAGHIPASGVVVQ